MRVDEGNIDQVIMTLAACPALSVDTETTGLGELDRPFAAIVANATDIFYFDTRVLGDFWPKLQYLFTPGRYLYFQNAKFDMRMLSYMGLNFEGAYCVDAAVLARLLRNDHFGKGAYSLDGQAKRELGLEKDTRVVDYIKKHDLYEKRYDFFGAEVKQPRYDWVPIEIMEEYAERDAYLTYKLADKYRNIPSLWGAPVTRIEIELTPVCFAMERRGLQLNKSYTIEAMYHERSKRQEVSNKFEALTGTAFVNSAVSVQRHLDWQLTRTEAGNPSLTDDVIEDILASPGATEKDRAVVTLVRDIRHYDKRINTYYESYLNSMSPDGVIHPTMWQAGTRTGRFSYSDPNLQNVPKEEDSTEPFVIRGCFMPREGHVFVSMDYSQMEYRMMAAYAGETEVIRQVLEGMDIHQVTANALGISRKYAKTLNFAILYGAGDEKLAMMLGIPPEQAKLLRYKYFMNLSKVEALIDSVVRTAKQRGYIVNWLGRKLYFDWRYDAKNGKWHDAYSAPNHLIQGGGADVVKVAMVRIAKEFPDLRMVLQIHDQLIFEMTPPQYRWIPRIKEIMESVFPPMNGMKLPVDLAWSPLSLAERDMIKGVP